MGSSFRDIIPTQSDDEVRGYILNCGRYVPEAVEVAIAELARRGKGLSEVEIAKVRADILRIEQARKDEQEPPNSRTEWLKGGRLVEDPSLVFRNPFLPIILFLYRFFAHRDSSDSSYYRAALTVVGILAVNLDAILVLAGVPGIIPYGTETTRGQQIIQVGLTVLIPGFLIVRIICPKPRVVEYRSDEASAAFGGILLVVWLVLTIVLSYYSYRR